MRQTFSLENLDWGRAAVTDTEPPQIGLLSLNGGQTFSAGQTATIQWTANDAIDFTDLSIEIEYTTDGTNYVSIASGLTNTGSFNWPIPAITSSNVSIRVSAIDATGNRASDLSDSSFIVDGVAPSITLTAPNGATGLRDGQTTNITWTASDVGGLAANPITIEYTTDGTNYVSIATGEANDGTYVWTVPTLSPSTVRVRVTAVDLFGNSGTDSSDALVWIDSIAPSVTLLTPNGGESWQGTLTYAITWNASDADSGLGSTSIALAYTTNGTTFQSIAVNEANDGTYSWTIPTGITMTTVRVRITATDRSGNSATDLSNANFIVDNSSPTVILNAPNNYALFRGGQTTNITWTILDIGGFPANPVSLDYTTDGGTTFVPITSGETNDGTYTWTIPNIDSTTVKVRLRATDLGGNTGSDISTSNFTVDSTPPTFTFDGPYDEFGYAFDGAGSAGDTQFTYVVSAINGTFSNLTPAGLTFANTGTASCTASVSFGTSPTPIVMLSSCVGDGTVAFRINAGEAYDSAGNVNPLSSASPALTISNSLVQTAVGRNHACALSAGGRVKCWGQDDHGQLGGGPLTSGSSATPVNVFGLTKGVTAITAGGDQTCAIQYGAALCWGRNDSGELGDGTTTDRAEPTPVTGLTSGVTAISTADGFSCAIQNGAAACWGANTAGRLGNGTTTASSTPVAVTGLTTGTTAIATGGNHACAVQGGGAYCWGDNSGGRLGNGTTTSSSTPVVVSGLSSSVTDVSAGDVSCAVRSSQAYCWGLVDTTSSGGGGSVTSGTNVPVLIAGLGSALTQVFSGGPSWDFACGLSGGGVKCFGSDWGANPADYLLPATITGVTSGVATLARGSDSSQSCAVLTDGTAMCWDSWAASAVTGF